MTHYLVTGGAGFIGSHLVERLAARRGNFVTVLDDLSTGAVENLAHIDRARVRLVQGDIRDARLVDGLVARADVVYHLAAALGVMLAVQRPRHVLETNIVGTQRVLDAAFAHHRKVLLASSSEVYGKRLDFPLAEDDDLVLGPPGKSRWAYAASKLVDEFMALAYAQESGLDVVMIRLFNVIGPRQSGRYGMVVPRLVRQALAGEPMTIHGDGTQRRCFCHVKDAARAIEDLSRQDRAVGRIFNVGGQEEVSILELAHRIRGLACSDSPLRFVPYADAYGTGFEDVQRRIPDLARLHELLGWKPQYARDEILRDVIASEGRASQPVLAAPRFVSSD